MKPRTRKPAPLPIIAPGYTVKVIDDSGKVPMWKTLGHCAGPVPAGDILRKHGFKSGWIFDGFGGKEYVTC